MCCHSEVVLGLLLDHGNLRIEQGPFVDPVHACTTHSQVKVHALLIFARLKPYYRTLKKWKNPVTIFEIPILHAWLGSIWFWASLVWTRQFQRWICLCDCIPCGCCLRWIGLSFVCYFGETGSSYYGTFRVHGQKISLFTFILHRVRSLTYFRLLHLFLLHDDK